MKILTYILSVAVLAATAGCSHVQHVQERIRDAEVSTERYVMEDASATSPIPPGYADLTITASLKTHEADRFQFPDVHGTPGYRLLVNIDGEAQRIEGELHEEESRTHAIRNPEEGAGARYTFMKHIRLKAGPHAITVALPDDSVIADYDVVLEDKTENILHLRPIYGSVPPKQRVGFYGITSFLEGIRAFEGELNNQPLPETPQAPATCDE